MELGAGPDLEVVLEVHKILIDRDPALAVVDRVGRVDVDEAAGRDDLPLLAARHLLGGDDVGEEQVRIGEDADGDAGQHAEQAAGDEEDDRSQHRASLPLPPQAPERCGRRAAGREFGEGGCPPCAPDVAAGENAESTLE